MDGVVRLKNGGHLAAWWFHGRDAASSSMQDLDVYCSQVSQVFRQLDDGWTMHVDAYRVPAVEYPTVSVFPDHTTWIIDEERRVTYNEEGEHFETVYVISLSYVEHAPVEKKLGGLIVQSHQKLDSTRFEREMYETFLRGVANFEQSAGDLLNLRRMKRRETIDSDGRTVVMDDLLSHLHWVATGNMQRVRTPQRPQFIDAYLGGHDMVLGWKPMIGTKHVRVVGITGFPDWGLPGLLAELNNLSMPHRFSSRAILMSRAQARKELERYTRNWAGKTLDPMSVLFSKPSTKAYGFANEMKADADAAQRDNEAGDVKFLSYTGTVILMDEDVDRVEKMANAVLKILMDAGFAAQIETRNAVPAFMGSLPGNAFSNVRRPLIHTLNLAHLLPLTAVSSGLRYNPSPRFPKGSPPLFYANTTGNTPYRFNLHVDDIGHTMIVGPSGSGKSTLLALIVAQFFRYPGARVFAFDKGYSMYALARATGAAYYDINNPAHPRGTLSFAPLARIQDPAERAWMAEWIEGNLFLQGVPTSPSIRDMIRRGLIDLSQTDPHDWKISQLLGLLSDPHDVVAPALKDYTRVGPIHDLLDSAEDHFKTSRFSVFEMEHVLGLNERLVVPILRYLFHVIEGEVADERPTLIILDEAWLMFENPVFAEYIRGWLKYMRKKNCAVVFATQNLNDLERSTLYPVLISECLTKVFLADDSATNEIQSKLYRAVGLTDYEIQLIARLKRKRQYFHVSPNGRRPFDLELGDVALSFLGVGDKEGRDRIDALAEESPQFWVSEWLKERGLPKWAEYWLKGDPEAASRAASA